MTPRLLGSLARPSVVMIDPDDIVAETVQSTELRDDGSWELQTVRFEIPCGKYRVIVVKEGR